MYFNVSVRLTLFCFLQWSTEETGHRLRNRLGVSIFERPVLQAESIRVSNKLNSSMENGYWWDDFQERSHKNVNRKLESILFCAKTNFISVKKKKKNHLNKNPPFKVDNLWAPSHPGEAKQLNQLNLINRMSFFYSLPLHPYGPCWGRICSPQDCLPAGALEACGWLQFWKKIIWDLHYEICTANTFFQTSLDSVVFPCSYTPVWFVCLVCHLEGKI